jgi:hypothetical protein
MNQNQIQKTIRTLEGELKDLDLQRGTLLEAITSLRRLLPAETKTNGSGGLKVSAEIVQAADFPGITDGIMGVIAEGHGRPIPVGTIREAFRQRGWLITKAGQDRSKTIYETLRRLNKSGRLRKMGKRGYVIPEPPGDPRIGDTLGISRPGGGGS